MDKVIIQGGNRLMGSVKVSGAKNAALPILVSALLTDQLCVLDRVPRLADIDSICALLKQLGIDVNRHNGSQLQLQMTNDSFFEAPYDLVRKMRASVLVLAPLLARRGKAKVSLPGGCAIGARPINYHLQGLKALGAQIELENGYVVATAKRLQGARIVFEFPSVGATESLLMAAALSQGESILENCAKEPEIVDLAEVLKKMGAQIEGEGTETIQIQGASRLRGFQHSVMADRIEAGTYLAGAFITRGKVKVEGMNPTWLDAVLGKFQEAGAEVIRSIDSIELNAENRPKPCDITTAPFPGFPTDMQAQFMVILALADGASTMTETIFENRFMHVPELVRLGADITLRGNSAFVRGKARLKGAPLMATDLRASAGLILGALAAEGETVVNRIYHLDRGYECMDEKLRQLGAVISRVH